jgi:hypothetical protein
MLQEQRKKMMRKICKRTKTEDGRWKRKTNKEIKGLQQYGAAYKGTKVAGIYRRMPEYRHAKRSLLEREGGKRPKKKWLEAVTVNVRVLGVTDWKKALQGQRTMEKNSQEEL